MLSGSYWTAFDTVQVWDIDLHKPMLEVGQIAFDGSLAPLWLADLAEAISGKEGVLDYDDELAPRTVEEIRKKYPADEVIWRRFFPK